MTLLARQIVDTLNELCPGLSMEAVAVALGLELRPQPRASYRYRRVPAPHVEYDSLGSPAEQERCLQRAIVCRCIDVLDLTAKTPSILAVTSEVFPQLPRLRIAPAPSSERSA